VHAVISRLLRWAARTICGSCIDVLRRVNGMRTDLFKDAKAEWLEKARQTARELLKRREWITSEDVTAICPLPKYLHRNTIGGIFQHEDFQMVGVTYARRREAHGRLIRKWALKNQPVPRKWQPKMEYDHG